MSVNSDAIRKDVGGSIVLEIVIGVALPIRDGLPCNPQESAPPTVAIDVGSYAPPLIGITAVFDHCVAFVIVLIVAKVKVLLMPLLLRRAPGGDK